MPMTIEQLEAWIRTNREEMIEATRDFLSQNHRTADDVDFYLEMSLGRSAREIAEACIGRINAPAAPDHHGDEEDDQDEDMPPLEFAQQLPDDLPVPPHEQSLLDGDPPHEGDEGFLAGVFNNDPPPPGEPAEEMAGQPASDAAAYVAAYTGADLGSHGPPATPMSPDPAPLGKPADDMAGHPASEPAAFLAAFTGEDLVPHDPPAAPPPPDPGPPGQTTEAALLAIHDRRLAWAEASQEVRVAWDALGGGEAELSDDVVDKLRQGKSVGQIVSEFYS